VADSFARSAWGRRLKIRDQPVATGSVELDAPAVRPGEGMDVFALSFPAIETGEEPAQIQGVLIDAAGSSGFEGVFDEERQMFSVLNHKQGGVSVYLCGLGCGFRGLPPALLQKMCQPPHGAERMATVKNWPTP